MSHLKLSELNNLIKKTLEKELSPSYWIIAEISEMQVNSKGHCYLELVEKQDARIIAKSRATIWSYTYSNLSIWFERMTGQSLKSGMKILFNATIQYHEVFGLSINIKDIDANYTIGERALKRQKIIQQLKDDGVLKMNKELALPLVPQRIAIISSETAAGYGDFINQIKNNLHQYDFKTQLFQATMQGEQAASSIINALISVHNNIDQFDLVVVIRGGGSQLDLDCFDDYNLNSHIAQFPLPLITGIGHERDETIADLVAHTSIKTPTAVAEFLINGVRSFEESVEIGLQDIATSASVILNTNDARLIQLALKLDKAGQNRLSERTKGLLALQHRISYASKLKVNELDNRLTQLGKHIENISPEKILKRGYTLTSVNNKLIKTNPKPGDVMVTETLESKITSTVNHINKK